MDEHTLLEALAELVKWWDARAVIAKAKGETES